MKTRSYWNLFVFVLTTTWIGHCFLWRQVRRLWAMRILLSETKRCARGHRTPLYGVYECRCKAIVEGFVFRRCSVCRAIPSWTPCRKCGLPLRNPL